MRTTRKLSGQGAFGDRGCGCSSTLLRPLAVVALVVALGAGLFFAMDAMPPAQPPPGDNPTQEMGR